MFGRKRKRQEKPTSHLQGVVTFFGSHHALLAEKVLKSGGQEAVLIPGPREISPNCGVALRYDYALTERCREILDKNSVHYEAFHLYPEE